MKYYLRMSIANIMIGLIVSMLLKQTIEYPKDNMQVWDWFIMSWIVVSVFTSLSVIIYLWYHWGISKFKSNEMRIMWFFVLLIGMCLFLVGHLVYYVMVYELKYTLREKRIVEQS